MMQPKTVKLYVGDVESITNDFIERIRVIRDEQNEMPADFSNELNKWSLESISYIALSRRLGLLKETDSSSKGQQLIEVCWRVLELDESKLICYNFCRAYTLS